VKNIKKAIFLKAGWEKLSVSNKKLCHVIIDAKELMDLDESSFYQIVALKVIRELLKSDAYEGLLNVPLPKNNHAFNLFLLGVQEVLPTSHKPILIIMHNPQALNQRRRDRFSEIFSLAKRGRERKIGLVLA